MFPKSNSFRFAAFVLAVTVLLSSFGATVGVHFCQDNPVSLGFFAKANSCVDMADDEACDGESNSGVNNISKKNCCSDRFISAKAVFIADQVLSFQSVHQVFGLSAIHLEINDLYDYFGEAIELNHDPPLITQNTMRRVLFQTFLL